MEKLIKTSVLAVCVLCMSSAAFAGYTYTQAPAVTETLNNSNYGYPPFKPQSSSPGTVTAGTVLTWTHDISGALPASDTPLTVYSAALDILAYNGMDAHGVVIDSTTEIGVLGGGSGAWVTTSFNLLNPIDVSATLVDGVMTVSVNVGQYDQSQCLALASSTLTVVYTVGTWEEEPEPEPTIPVPGAIVLGSIGAGLVGWLRRRIA